MGKKKIPMEFIEDPRKRKLCFDKRQQGLVKKAMELSRLAKAQVGLIIISEENNSLVEFWSQDKSTLVQRYQTLAAEPHYDFTLDDYEQEISNALALKPFPLLAAERSYMPANYPAEAPSLKRPRYAVEAESFSDSSSFTPSQPPSPVYSQHTGLGQEPKTWNGQQQLQQGLEELVGLSTSLGQLCDSVLSYDGAGSPTTPLSTSTGESTLDEQAELSQATMGDIDVSGMLNYIKQFSACSEPPAASVDTVSNNPNIEAMTYALDSQTQSIVGSDGW